MKHKVQQTVSPALLLPMKSHIEQWGKCRLCTLCESRFRPVIFRGRIPCDVLFIGEAPGDAENIGGIPFAPLAPSGSVIERIIADTGGNPTPSLFGPIGKPAPARYSWALTNTVACYSEGPPPEQSLYLCSDRLLELKRACSPKLIVAVGKVADHTVTKYGINKQTKMTVIDHPTRMFIEAGNDNDALELSIRKAIMAVEEGLGWLKI